MPDTITLTGIVATIPRNVVTADSLAITSFRLASTQRRFDKSAERWVDAETNWFTVTGFRQLALNLAASVKKGDRVVVSGRLRIRDWSNGDRSGTTIEVEADAVGHDMAWGSSSFARTVSTSSTDTAPAQTPSQTENPADASAGWGVPMAPEDLAREVAPESAPVPVPESAHELAETPF